MTKVFDAWGILAWIQNEQPAASLVRRLLIGAGEPGAERGCSQLAGLRGSQAQEPASDFIRGGIRCGNSHT